MKSIGLFLVFILACSLYGQDSEPSSWKFFDSGSYNIDPDN